ncbi:hypothetical protein BDV28DRAFT_165484 [Aspergillus coremiiformis]|uniref:Uncharacterized protein n=1 Tax=Aspergillus coremiiformis TaxID=138285 RepID=A0A5N6Z4F4_9EURO|nr:hypothetical protein BDV28DRAFT_165484 [Aspergillus coremiiformis]
MNHLHRAFMLFLLMERILAASTARYTIPILRGTVVLETRQQLNDMATAYSTGTLDDRNGGYYLLDDDGNVLAVAADSLCEELDASMASARRVYERHPYSELYDGEIREIPIQSERSLRESDGNACSHPRCYTHALCGTYNDCFVCSSNHHWCY